MRICDVHLVNKKLDIVAPVEAGLKEKEGTIRHVEFAAAVSGAVQRDSEAVGVEVREGKVVVDVVGGVDAQPQCPADVDVGGKIVANIYAGGACCVEAVVNVPRQGADEQAAEG